MIGDEIAINRYALDWLPVEVALTATWVYEHRDLWLGWASEATDAEKECLRPGLNLLVEIITGALEDAEAEAHHLKQSLAMSADELAASNPDRWLTVARAEEEQQGWRRAGRAVLRGYLRDVVVAAESIGIPPSELPALLDQVLSAGEPVAMPSRPMSCRSAHVDAGPLRRPMATDEFGRRSEPR